MPGPARWLTAALAALAAAPLAGCGSNGSVPSAGPTTAVPTVTVSPCPSGPAAVVRWPAGVPAGFPRPAGLRLLSVQRSGHLVTVRAAADLSLRDSVILLLTRLRAAGFRLGQGDSESDEADLPFGRASFVGKVRVRTATECSTQWLVVVASGSGSPVQLPGHT